ncbi:MAG: hypothetical protein ACKVOH_02365 [Chlamydiales bacterium]
MGCLPRLDAEKFTQQNFGIVCGKELPKPFALPKAENLKLRLIRDYFYGGFRGDMGKSNITKTRQEEESSPFVFFAAFTFILAVLGVAASGLGILGLLHYPQVDFLNHNSSLFCTTFGGACAVIFLISGFMFSSKADAESLPPVQRESMRNFKIERGQQQLRVITKKFQQRIDLLNALSKQQKFDCLSSGEWTFHETKENSEPQYYILGKFTYVANKDEEKRCRVRLKVLPLTDSASGTNVYFNQKNRKLVLMQEGRTLPFKGSIANNYLVQKTWIFAGRNFDEMISA